MDQYSEVTTQGLGSRLINSIKRSRFRVAVFHHRLSAVVVE